MKISKLSCCGSANSGKDTLQQALTSILEKYNIKSRRYSFGDFIKAEMRDFLLFCHGVDIFNCSRAEKDSIRDLIIKYGYGRRKETNGLAFIEQLEDYLKENRTIRGKQIYFPIITDLRFKEYDYDEVDFCKENNGLILYVQKLDSHGDPILPIIPVEIENDPKLRAAADYIISWPDGMNLNQCINYINNDYLDVISYIVKNS